MTKLLQFKRKGISRPQLISSADHIFLLSHLSILGPVNLDFFILNSLLQLLSNKLDICPAKTSLKDFM